MTGSPDDVCHAANPRSSDSVTVRALFYIDPKHTIRAIIYYPLNVGRNVDEILRVLEALQTADGNGVACPVNWKKGDKVIVPPPKSYKEVEARAAMQAFLTANPKNKHGVHRYSLAQYGLDRETELARFKVYCDRFDIPVHR